MFHHAEIFEINVELTLNRFGELGQLIINDSIIYWSLILDLAL